MDAIHIAWSSCLHGVATWEPKSSAFPPPPLPPSIPTKGVTPGVQDSAQNLYSRMGHELPDDRWRPNIVVEGGEPWAEDFWERVTVGNAREGSSLELASVRPCDRCKVASWADCGERCWNPHKCMRIEPCVTGHIGFRV